MDAVHHFVFHSLQPLVKQQEEEMKKQDIRGLVKDKETQEIM
jgi:hypothetical protein